MAAIYVAPGDLLSFTLQSAVASGMASGRALVPVLPLFAAFFVHSLLPTGAFGSHDLAIRALVTGATAAVVAMLVLRKRASTN